MQMLIRILCGVATLLIAHTCAQAQTSLTLSPTQLSVPARGSGQILVTLDAPAAFDTSVAISSAPTTALSLPATVVIAQGSLSAFFTVTAVTESGSALVVASLGNQTATAQVTIGPGALSISLAPSTVAIPAFGTTTLTASLSSPAPAGGLQLAVSADPVNSLQTPASVLVPAGATIVSFLVTARVPMGMAAVSVTDGHSVATSDVAIGTGAPSQCTMAVSNAVSATNSYISRVNLVPSACIQAGAACKAKVADATTALMELKQFERLVRSGCVHPGR